MLRCSATLKTIYMQYHSDADSSWTDKSLIFLHMMNKGNIVMQKTLRKVQCLTLISIAHLGLMLANPAYASDEVTTTKKHLTYAVSGATPNGCLPVLPQSTLLNNSGGDLKPDDDKVAIAKAFSLWHEVTDLSFSPVNNPSDADIVITWLEGPGYGGPNAVVDSFYDSCGKLARIYLYSRP